MIIDSYDTSKPIVTPDSFYPRREPVCSTCILTFSSKIVNHAIARFPHSLGPAINNVNGTNQIYYLDIDGQKIALFLCRVGAPTASMDMICVHQFTGATNFIIFGSAGSLDNNTKGKYVIPSEAYRDEGISYHYAPASDFIKIKNSNKLESIFSKLEIPHTQGKIWTTDALYMETEELLKKRVADGCVAVDMEIAGLQAVADYYGYELYCFLETGDVLCGPKYEKAGLAKANHQLNKLYIALDIAKLIK